MNVMGVTGDAGDVGLQLYDWLDVATEAALRASIKRFGVLVPVVMDQFGKILDGHHRSRIAGELGVECPMITREVADEAEAREIARTLNEDRRMLTREQRLPVVRALREEGHSIRAIAGALNIDRGSVENDIRKLKSEGVVTTTPQTTGLDGKKYPASQQGQGASAATKAPGRHGVRDRSKPFTINTKRDEDRARAHTLRITTGLSEINGICRGLLEVDYKVAAAYPDGDLSVWITKLDHLARSLRTIKSHLQEAINDSAS